MQIIMRSRCFAWVIWTAIFDLAYGENRYCPPKMLIRRGLGASGSIRLLQSNEQNLEYMTAAMSQPLSRLPLWL